MRSTRQTTNSIHIPVILLGSIYLIHRLFFNRMALSDGFPVIGGGAGQAMKRGPIGSSDNFDRPLSELAGAEDQRIEGRDDHQGQHRKEKDGNLAAARTQRLHEEPRFSEILD